MQILRHRRQTHMLLLLGICVLLMSLVPTHQVEARQVPKSLDDTVSEFTGGTFQRASLSNYKAAEPSADQPGAAQLSPIGLLKFQNIQSAFPLPTKLQRAGAAVVSNGITSARIFVTGGVANGTPTKSVYSVKIDLTNGSLLGPWDKEPDLVAVQSSNLGGFTTPVAAVNSHGIASVTVKDGSRYLYVIGGDVNFGTNDVSSYAVRYAKIGLDDRIDASTGWQELAKARIPSSDKTDTSSQLGLISPAVTTYVNPDTSTTYIYAVGGLQRALIGTGSQSSLVSSGSKSIFVTRVGADGKLYKANTTGDTTTNEGWQLLDVQVPIKDADISNTNARSSAGIWDSMAVADHFEDSLDANGKDALFVMGGQIAPAINGPATYTSNVYIFYIQADGSLKLSANTAILPESRYGHSGVEFRNNIYLTGGNPSGTANPNSDVLTSYIISKTLTLPTFGGAGGANFLRNATGLPKPRVFHSTVLVKNSQGDGYIYVLGGIGSSADNDTSDDSGSDTVFYSSLNSNDARAAGFPQDGWYYSKPFELFTSNVEVRQITWTTLMSATDNMDVAVDYRISNDGDCQALRRSTTSPWVPLDGSTATANRSTTGANSVDFDRVNTRCFQYRAHLISLGVGSQAPTATPSLLNVKVIIVVPGSPDLKVDAVTQLIDTTDKVSTVGVSATIANRNDTAPKAANPTLAADINGGGSIYVDLFVFEGSTPTTPTLPLNGSLDQFNRGCAQIPTSRMTADSTITINKWYDPIADGSCGLGNTTPITVGVLFPKTDTTYTVLVAVDTACPENPAYACIDERDAEGGENNNIKWQTMQIKTVKVVVLPDPEQGPIVYKAILPIISRN